MQPDFPPAAIAELRDIPQKPSAAKDGVRDLRALPWASIDNDDSRDLDQLSVAGRTASGATTILVAVADVDALVKRGSAIDEHARTNTTSVYTAAGIFPMLPEKLSTGLTSLNENEDRLAIVTEMTLDADGAVTESVIYRAVVRNQAKLAYNALAEWLDGGAMPPHLQSMLPSVPALEEQLRTQDRAAQSMRRLRHRHGALSLQTPEARPVFEGDELADLAPDDAEPREGTHRGIHGGRQRRHGAFPGSAQVPVLPARAALARALGAHPRARRGAGHAARWPRLQGPRGVPAQGARCEPGRVPRPFALGGQAAGPRRIRGRVAGAEDRGPFRPRGAGLHALDGAEPAAFPTSSRSAWSRRRWPARRRRIRVAELQELAAHCTAQEDNAAKVERQVRKSAAALLLATRIGERFDAIVTGASDKGTWVRIAHPTAEGKLVTGAKGLDVGDRVMVKLLRLDVERGFIDFGREGKR